jgi:hypothetical protein
LGTAIEPQSSLKCKKIQMLQMSAPLQGLLHNYETKLGWGWAGKYHNLK